MPFSPASGKKKLRKKIMHYRIVLKGFSVMNDHSISSEVLLTALKAGKVLVHYFHWQYVGYVGIQ
jgi:hypothetical protein